jgi:hypothetical protein
MSKRGNNSSFQVITKRNIDVAPKAGRDRGSAIDRYVLQGDAPSTWDTSNISFGNSLKNAVKMKTEIGKVVTTLINTSPDSLFVRLKSLNKINIGTRFTCPGIANPTVKRTKRIFPVTVIILDIA